MLEMLMRGKVRLVALGCLRWLHVVPLCCYKVFREYVAVVSSKLFDADWYLKRYPDVAQTHRDPAWHYVDIGWKEGRQPGPNFDGKAYLEANPDVRKAGMNPLVHYVLYGQKAKRPLAPASKAKVASPVPKPTPKNAAADMLAKDMSAVAKSPLFDAAWYLRRYPDVAKVKIDPVRHYCMTGWKEGRQPGPNFDGNAYLAANPDVRKRGWNPLLHYELFGRSGRDCHNPVEFADEIQKKVRNLVDEVWYLKRYPEVAATGVSAAEHYMRVGWIEGKDPSPTFSTSWYLRSYPSVRKVGMNPLLHFIKYGEKEGRSISKERKCPFFYTAASDVPECTGPRADAPLISVVVASYDYEKYISETLDGLVAQTYRNFEVLVVDDGSKDGSVDLIKGYAKKDARIRLLQHEGGINRGLVKTLQLAFKECKGEYVAFCESDDIWTPDHLEKKVEVIRKFGNPDVISNDVQLVGDYKRCQELEQFALGRIRRALCRDVNRLTYDDFRQSNWIPTFSSVMIRAERLAGCDLSGNPRPSATDWWLYRQLAAKACLFYHVPEKITFWRMHQSYNKTQVEDYGLRQDIFNRASDEKTGKRQSKGLVKFGDAKIVAVVSESSLFDANWYRSEYRIDADMDPARHYYYCGWRHGCNPSKEFDGDLYLSWNSDVRSADMCPLSHYEMFGRGRRLLPPVMDPTPYDVMILTTTRVQDGVYIWRLEFMKDRLEKLGLSVRTRSLENLDGCFLPELRDAGCVIFNRPHNSGASLQVLSALRQWDKRLIIDMDDLILEENAASSGAYRSAMLSYDKLVSNMHMQSDCYKFAHGMMVSTPLIARRFTEVFDISPIVVPNAIPRDYCKMKRRDTTSGFRLLYSSGTLTHVNDFSSAYVGILNFLLAHEDATLTIMGRCEAFEQGFSIVKDRVCFVPYGSFQTLLDVCAAHDLLLVPLEDTAFNNAKSNIKYIEAGAVGTPVLARSCAEFRSVIRDGVNGFLYENDLREKLEAIYVKRVDLFAVGRAAFEDVMDNRTTNAVISGDVRGMLCC